MSPRKKPKQPQPSATWLDVQRQCVCVPEHAVGAVLDERFACIAQSVYPDLVRSGYRVPLSVVVDLACLFEDGPDHDYELAPPREWPADVQPEDYCLLINMASKRGGPINHVLRGVHQARRQAGKPLSKWRPRRGENASSAGLVTFLELMLSALVRFCDKELPVESGPPDRFTNELADGKNRADPGGRVSARFVSDFCQTVTMMPNRLENMERFRQSFDAETVGLLVPASVRVPAGADGLDLRVLQASLDYQPLRLSDSQSLRYYRLQRSLLSQQLRSTKSPESGNHGVTVRGGLTSVLRSYMARDEFVDLVYMNKALYLDRFARRQEPYRALLAWVVDRGRLMQRRSPPGQVVPRQRFDSVVRTLAAAQLEDAVRYFSHFPALDLRLAIVLHDGSDKTLHEYCIVPRPFEISLAPSPESGPSSPAWFPAVADVMPAFYLRDMIWPDAGSNSEASTGGVGWQHRRPYQRALRTLVVRGSAGFMERDNAAACDLCHVTVMGPAEGLPFSRDGTGHSAEDQENLRFLRNFATDVSISYVAFESNALHVRAFPHRAGCSTGVPDETTPAYYDQPLAEHPIRGLAWDLIVKRLLSL